MAAMSGHKPVCKTLLELGADINAVNNNDMTPLMAAAFAGRKDVVTLLLQEPTCDVEKTTTFSGPSLMINVEQLPRHGGCFR